MFGTNAPRNANEGNASRDLYRRIGTFLTEQRLEPEPVNYTFAYAVMRDPNGPIALAVKELTDGGVRLTRADIESLGHRVAVAENRDRGDGLVARTQMQVEGFEDMVQAIRAEAQGFGRDLAASADAIRTGGAAMGVDEVARLTGTMIERVQSAEQRLEAATQEASSLRAELEEARENARRDPLTDLPNRRAVEEAYAVQAAAGETLCLAVCDIDHFKDVNDQFGHAVGDRVLKAIGESLSMACAGHMVARYGGEEFAVLFTAVDMGTARATLDATRTLVAAKRYRLRESDAPLGEITFSAGLVAAVQGESFGDAFRRADALLYAAKDSGRNCLKAA
ncbi:GGDEF domain-containing protein [soil metagenome]